MEIFIFPILVFFFVLFVIVSFNRLSTLKKQVEIKKRALLSARKAPPQIGSEDSSLAILQQDFEKSARRFNRAVGTFPTSIMAKVSGYSEVDIK